MGDMRRMMAISVLALVSASGCGPILHSEMLGESIRVFSSKMKPAEKVWIAGPGDSACDSGCWQGNCKSDKGALGSVGGLFSAKPANSPSPHDGLAYQIFSNYLVQRKKAKVVETHRHNYSTELQADTHRKIEFVHDNAKVATTSCEDLCLLDEAKKRKADKVLAYSILEMKNNEMTIHMRYSDVPTGLVEASQTLKVVDLQAQDASFGTSAPMSGGRGRSSRSTASEPAD
jgi:hypothetical protein